MYVDPSGHITDTQRMVVYLVIVIACINYIGEYAEKNNKDINAFVDFLDRTTDEDTSLYELSRTLLAGSYILMGNNSWITVAMDLIGISGDLSDITSKLLGSVNKGGMMSTVIGAGLNILMDFYNPLMYNEEVNLNIPIHMANALAGAGIGKFSVELAGAVTAATGGNIVAGMAVGTAFYFIATYGWNSFADT